MNEEFLTYVWRFRLLGHTLITTSGEPLEILVPGEHNANAGPDFFNARIRIGGTLWAGNVELHVLASDWYRHGHHNDPAYKNTVLHVVYEDDLSGTERDIPGLPVFVCKGHFDESIFEHYHYFSASKAWIPCTGHLRDVDRMITESWLESKAVERLERKSLQMLELIKRNHHHWEQSFYECVARAFGAKVNADAFERLARSLPLQVLAKEKNDLFHLEVLLFGQAGLLEGEALDDYHRRMKAEYRSLKRKYKLQGLPTGTFRFLRLRPPNFPTIRIAQFAFLIHRSSGLFAQVLHCSSTDALLALFRTHASEYWDRHYRFGKVSMSHPKKMGDDSVSLILVNTVVPFLFIYGKEKHQNQCCDLALSFLDRLPPEENNIVRKFRMAGLAVSNALGSQALLEMKDKYCNAKKCLDCGIGHWIFTHT